MQQYGINFNFIQQQPVIKCVRTSIVFVAMSELHYKKYAVHDKFGCIPEC